MNSYQIIEADGTNWGLWAAESADEAVRLLKADLESNSDAYSGEPTGELVAVLS